MASDLLSTIEQAKKTQRALIAATDHQSEVSDRDLVNLRKQFLTDMLAISQVSRGDTKLKSDPARYAEFSKRHNEAQDMLSRHQSKWMLRAIERDFAGYKKATAELRRAQEDYFNWAINWVKGS